MANWKHHIKLKDLFTDEEDHETVQKTMNTVADRIEKDSYFNSFNRNIPTGDDMFGPIDYANKLLESIYNFADEHLIWVD